MDSVHLDSLCSVTSIVPNFLKNDENKGKILKIQWNISFRRITTFATECGYIKLIRVDVKTNTILYNFSTKFGNCVSKVCIYPEVRTNEGYKESQKAEKLNLVVVNSIHPAVIFQYVFNSKILFWKNLYFQISVTFYNTVWPITTLYHVWIVQMFRVVVKLLILILMVLTK